MNDKSLPKYVRDKIREADNGDLYSCYTVGNYYIDEKTLDVDIDKSDYYFSKVSEHLNNADFRVKELTVFDYKRFKKIQLKFPHNGTTVIIGNNGAGKSTILEAMAKNLQFLSDNIRVNNNNYKFHESEINVESKNGYAIVACDIEINNKYSFSCSLTKNNEGIPRKVPSELEQFKVLGSMLQESSRLGDDDFPYPLLAYYPVERSITIKREDVTKKKDQKQYKNILNKIEGHHRPFDGTSNFDAFFHWFKEVDDIINEYKAKDSFSHKDIQTAMEGGKSSKEIVDMLLASSKEVIDKASGNATEEKYRTVLSNHLNTVKEAIKNFLSNIEDINISRAPYLDMYVDKKGKKFSIFNLSQGEKTLLALVSDIARRLVTLNPNSKQPLHGKGVVIIDELDLHLHPRWQQTVISNLEKTFPKIQFIVSTHSPLILTTVTSKQIKILSDDDSSTELTNPDINPYGKISAEALAIMDTPEKPQLADDITDSLNAYEELIKSGKEEEEETLKIKEYIEKTGYTIDESQLELWRFIASNSKLFINTEDLESKKK